MNFKNILGFRENKLEDCQPDESGMMQCRIGIRHKNNLLNTGTQFSYSLDNQCKAHLVGRAIILDEDEEAVRKALKRAEANCRGGSSVN